MSNMTVCRIHTPQLEDIPELIHIIQSLLPVKEAARTSILSKSWLHAWSTIPGLRFSPDEFRKFATDEQEIKYKKVIEDTLQRYRRDNISIESLDLELHIQNQESAFAAEKWIQPIVSKSCLKELSLNMPGLNDSLRLPNELFSSEKLSTINLRGGSLQLCSNPVIKCVTLRVLDLQDVNATEEVVHDLLSTCTLLEKIKLWRCKGLDNVLVKNLCHLREMVIESSLILEIKDVPSLRLFDYKRLYCVSNKRVPFKIDSLASVRKLSLGGMVILDHAILDIIRLKFLWLECLTLDIKNCVLESLVITSASLKSLRLSIWEEDRQVNVQVYAPKLVSFSYHGKVHGLLFPTITPKDMHLTYFLSRPMDHVFFLTLMEVLNSSSEFTIYITEHSPAVPSNIDVDDLRRRRSSVPVTNVQRLWLSKYSNVNLGFFDAFFSICHPCYIMLCKLMVREMMKSQPTDLKDVELKNPYNRKWETLTNSSTSFLDEFSDWGLVECKLNWVSR